MRFLREPGLFRGHPCGRPVGLAALWAVLILSLGGEGPSAGWWRGELGVDLAAFRSRVYRFLR
ncbi:hypothetical protein C0V72_05310 [Porphyrobacter sp. TH134]|nr:hypothetical protein C0V72_05310 [Porphyrobacter sp. TH134]